MPPPNIQDPQTLTDLINFLQNFTEATVNIGNVSPQQDSAYVANQNTGIIYTDYMVNMRFERDNQILMAGITSPSGFGGNSVAFFQMASATLLLVVDWTAAQVGDKPTIPDATPTNTQFILLDAHNETAMITLAADGLTPLYRISGTYVYGCLNPSNDFTNDLKFPIPPWIQNNYNRDITGSDVSSEDLTI